ncbi:nuclear transport factor 2 family protein [Streptomyces sp. NPDC048251]|uniref:nuclear transport factor 2 family protein n=1 Tax=Streptomyces sp. NPDC048251 TaxID=3154501 RepID=UPI0034135123
MSTADDIFDFAAYEEAFNSGDDDTLVDRYFADDVIFAGSSMTLRGREEVRGFLHKVHDGILETMRPQSVQVSPGRVAALIDMDFQATKDLPGFQFGPLATGESLTVKFFCFYETEAGQIKALRAAIWEAGRGVSPRPTMITPDAAGRRSFLDYTAAFSNGLIDRFTEFYNDDIELVLPSVTLRGKEEIADFYTKMFATVNETLTPHRIIADDRGLAVELTSRFTAVADAPDLVIGPLAEGESYEGHFFIHYTLRDGRISRIDAVRKAPLRGPFRG